MIPTYNSESTICQTLASIAAQTVLPHCVWVVDDCSTDLTLTKVSQFKSNLNLKTFKLTENLGPWAARNAGVRASNADYVAFVDSDDLLLPDHVAAHLAIFELGYDAVATNYFDWIPEQSKSRLDPRIFPIGQNEAQLILKKNFVAGFSSIKRNVFEDLGGFREEVTEDWDLWIRFFRSKYSISKTVNPTYLYRWREGSISRAPDSYLRDLKTLELARLESASHSHKLVIDRKVASMMIRTLLVRDQFHLSEEDAAVQNLPWLLRIFHKLLTVVDKILSQGVKKFALRLQQQIISSNEKFKFNPINPCLRFDVEGPSTDR